MPGHLFQEKIKLIELMIIRLFKQSKANIVFFHSDTKERNTMTVPLTILKMVKLGVQLPLIRKEKSFLVNGEIAGMIKV